MNRSTFLGMIVAAPLVTHLAPTFIVAETQVFVPALISINPYCLSPETLMAYKRDVLDPIGTFKGETIHLSEFRRRQKAQGWSA